MIEAVKKALRLSNTSFDDEITDLIAGCKQDLKISGVDKLEESDPLIKRAIILYCKANFGVSNPESEKFRLVYETLRDHLALSLEYREVSEDVS